MSNVQKMLSFIVRTYLTGLTMPLPNTRRTQTYKLTVNNKYTNLHNMQLIQETQFITTHERMPTRSTKTCDNSVLCPRTALDLGSSLFTLTEVVDLTPGTSLSRPGRTPLTRQPPAFLRRTIVDTSSLQRRTSTLPKRARRVGIHDVYPSTH